MTTSLISRRKLLHLAAAGGLAAALPYSAAAQPHSDKKANIVILGCGLAGLAAAYRLRRQVPNAAITLVDGKVEHNYQPGYTLLATGAWHDTLRVKASNAALIPGGVTWVQEAAAEIQPDARTVITTAGRRIPYDFLIVATGLRLGYEKIEGLDMRELGTKGTGSVYHSPEMALATWKQMDAFRKKGGHAVMTLAPTDMKCAGAPLKMTFMLADRVRQAGTAKNSKIDFFAPKAAIFSVPPVAQKTIDIWKTLDCPPQVHYWRQFTAVDMEQRIAYFTSPEGETTQEHYDFLHVVPPMFAPDVVFNNEDLRNDAGWLRVNPETLQHQKYPQIFGLGDVNGTTRGKTAATVKKSTPIVVNNLISVMNGKAPTELFDGYTSCPLLVREGEAMLVEFNGAGKLTPTLPLVDPLQPSYFAWYLEEIMLKPAYMTVLRGRA